jgi:arylformamidase
MRLYDISVGISPDLPIWPGDPPLELERFSKIEDGADANVTKISCCVHIGTHVDAPSHYIEGGAGVDALLLEVLIGRAYVVDLTEAEKLDAETLHNAGIPARTRRLLFKTRNSALWGNRARDFHQDYVGVDSSGAEWLVRKGIQLVGIDYLGIAQYKQTVEPHHILLKAGLVILEGLDLSQVGRGRYTLYCLPIKIVGSDGAPARAILAGV